MRCCAHSLTVFAAIAAHLLLAGVQIPHCHAEHNHVAEQCREGAGHGAHEHGHGHHHAAHAHHSDGCWYGDEQPDCELCLDAHENALAIPVRVERGGENPCQVARDAGMSVGWLVSAQPLGARQVICRVSRAAGRAASVHDLLPHVLRM